MYRWPFSPDGTFTDTKHMIRTIRRLIWNPTPGENCHPWTGEAKAAMVYRGNTLKEGWIKDAETGRARRVSAAEIKAWWAEQDEQARETSPAGLAL